jgi:hypothetical protein
MASEATSGARVIEVREARDEKEKEEVSADATQAKSGAAAPSSRLKAPPKASAEAPRSSTREATGSAISKVRTQGEKSGLPEEALTQVAQQKFEAQEEKLKDVARHSMSFLRDFQALSEPSFSKKAIEIRKALMKYEMQYIRVWELQDRTRKVEIEGMFEESGRLTKNAEVEIEVITELRVQLEKEKQRKRRYEVHEASAADINLKRTRTELQADIDAKNSEIAQLRQQKNELKKQAEELQQRGQLLREATADLQQLLVRHLDSPANAAASANQGGGSGRKAAGVGTPLVEVIS